jgi:hypothetical protein
MARARNIKPGFFKNEYLAELPAFTRLLFIGLWCVADREGRFEDRPRKIKMELFPADDIDVDAALGELEKSGFLTRYVVDGIRYAQIINFTKHQMPHHKEAASEIPAPPGHDQITRHVYDVPAEVRDAVFARDGNECLKCGSTELLSIDHIVPLASGGDNSLNNLQTLCKRCNSSKGNSIKDYRRLNVDPTLNQRCHNDGAFCPSDSLIPDSLIPNKEKTNKKESPDSSDSASTERVCSPPGGNPSETGQPEPPGRPRDIPNDEPSPVSPHGAIAAFVRSQGMQASASDQELKDLVATGATMAHFVDAVPLAKEKGKGWKYLLGIVRNMLQDERAPPPARRQASRSSTHEAWERINETLRKQQEIGDVIDGEITVVDGQQSHG